MVEPVSANATSQYLLALRERPYDRLTVCPCEEAAKSPSRLQAYRGHAAAVWSGTSLDVSVCIQGANGLYLALAPGGSWMLQPEMNGWMMQSQCHERRMQLGRVPSSPSPIPPASRADAFARDGYFVIPSLIPSTSRQGPALPQPSSRVPTSPMTSSQRAWHRVLRAAATDDTDEAGGVGVEAGKGHTCTCCLAQAVPSSGCLTKRRASISTALSVGGGESETTSPLSGRFGVLVALRFPLAPFGPGSSTATRRYPPRSIRRASTGTRTPPSTMTRRPLTSSSGSSSPTSMPPAPARSVRPGSHLAERHARLEGLPKGALHSATDLTGGWPFKQRREGSRADSVPGRERHRLRQGLTPCGRPELITGHPIRPVRPYAI